MIPKIIHFCWLSGDPYPELVKKCLESWHRILPDYEIKLWDRAAFDIESVDWVKEAFAQKKYAFAADYIRFFALYNYGGIYLDADVEVLKSFNDLLDRNYFIGEEAGGDAEAAIVGAEKKQEWIKFCLDSYQDRHFINRDGSLNTKPVPLLVNRAIKDFGLEIFPYQYFSPKDYNIGMIDIEPCTYSIHHFDGKWVKRDFKSRCKRVIHRAIYGVFGRKKHNAFVHYIRPLIS